MKTPQSLESPYLHVDVPVATYFFHTLGTSQN